MKNLPFSWFDILAFIVLVVGLFHGKKRGMSGELVDLMCALTLVLLPPLYYEPLAKLLNQHARITLFWANIISFLIIIFAVFTVVGIIKSKMGDKLVGSELFGRMEFHLGMFAGLIRYACYVLVFLALFNARYFTKATAEAEAAKQREALGSSFFPTISEIQLDVLDKSVIGSAVREHLESQLIRGTTYTSKFVNPAEGPAWKGQTLEDITK